MNEIFKGQRADDTTVVCLQRVAACINQQGAPLGFKQSVIAMMAGIIIEATR